MQEPGKNHAILSTAMLWYIANTHPDLVDDSTLMESLKLSMDIPLNGKLLCNSFPSLDSQSLVHLTSIDLVSPQVVSNRRARLKRCELCAISPAGEGTTTTSS